MLQLLKRVVPKVADKFILETIESENGKNVYEISQKNGRVVLRGDNKISQAMALNEYLKYVCKVNWSWVGNRQVILENIILPQKDIRHVVDQKWRVYMNYCTFSYSMAWWNWDRWEKEIDFMAMNGINMPLVLVGTEAIWFKTLQKFGFSNGDALAAISSNAFWPWQAMTNIEGYMPAPSEAYIMERFELGKKIFDRQLEFGMQPIQQGFSGHIPLKMKELFPKARISLKFKWCDFPKTAQLDPLDPLFSKFGKELLKTQGELFGDYHYYACDPFHEGAPPKKSLFYLRKVGKAIDSLYQSYDKDSCWVMQSWSLRQNIVKAVDPKRLLILDLNGEKCAATKNFWGYPFVTGLLHNFGGKNSLHGNLKEIAENEYCKLKNKNINVVGTGLFMEGIEQNPVYYDLAFELGVNDKPIDIMNWLESYAERRYGAKNEHAVKAWKMLLESCYKKIDSTEMEAASMLCARPDLYPPKCCCDDMGLVYDNDKLIAALKMLLNGKEKLQKSDGYQFDVCDITRQILSNNIVLRQKDVEKYFKEKDIVNFKKVADKQIDTMKDIDKLCATRSELTLAKWVTDAENLATNEDEKKFYCKCAKLLISIWGDVNGNATLFDYAWREWSGIIAEYYIPRWEKFYAYALRSLEANQPLESPKDSFFGRPRTLSTRFGRELFEFEKEWVNTYAEYPIATDKDVLPIAMELIKKNAI